MVAVGQLQDTPVTTLRDLYPGSFLPLVSEIPAPEADCKPSPKDQREGVWLFTGSESAAGAFPSSQLSTGCSYKITRRCCLVIF